VQDDAGYQYNEREWMKPDEYDLLIATIQLLAALLPAAHLRSAGALEHAVAVHRPRRGAADGPVLHPFRFEPVQQMLNTMAQAGRVALGWAQAFGAMDGKATATFGLPALAGGAPRRPTTSSATPCAALAA